MIAKAKGAFIGSIIVLTLAGSIAVAQPPQPTVKPAPAPARWRGLIGEYGSDDNVLIVFEGEGMLHAWYKRIQLYDLSEQSQNAFVILPGSDRSGDRFVFSRDRSGRATILRLETKSGTPARPLGKTSLFPRRNIEPETGNQLHVNPVRPVAELMKEALSAQPPYENVHFLVPDLVELRKLDPTIHLEIRYATTNNFLGTRFYSQARAFMQRPAAEAVVRANKILKTYGYGLLIHDAYRPWYVTKVFWDATPEDKHVFVADPAKGSRHNRGCAVDLTLYDLKTGKPIEMVSTYDETTDRAHSDYPGGTSRQRWHRDLLRRVMEGEGFAVYPPEWWHFDYKDWQKYGIGNVRFEEIR